MKRSAVLTAGLLAFGLLLSNSADRSCPERSWRPLTDDPFGPPTA